MGGFYTKKTAYLSNVNAEIKRAYIDELYVKDTRSGSETFGQMVNILNMIKTYTFDTQEVIDSVPSATTIQEGLVYLAENIDDTRENAVVNVSTFKTAVKDIEKKVNEQCGPFLRTNADRSVFYGNLDGLVEVDGLGVSGSNVTEWDIDIPNLIDGENLFRECTKLKKVVADFSSLENGSYMFRNCFSLTSFNSSLSSLTNGYYMFQNCSSLTSFDGSLSSLINGYTMFYGCASLVSFDSSLNGLTNGYAMFQGCSSLTSFNSSLSSLTNGTDMFYGCASLASFDCQLGSLTDGHYMFQRCYSLTSFNSSLSSLTNGHSMFRDCSSLTFFNSSLSSLTNGYYMFQGCSSLTSFNSSLSSLIDGNGMFSGCKLDLASVQNIASTINDLASKGKSGTLHLGYDSSLSDNSDLIAALTVIQNKGWTIK